MHDILINVLVFSGVLLLLALTVAVIQGIMILSDVRKMSGEIREKVLAITSLLDAVTMIFGALGGSKKKWNKNTTLAAFVGGLRKGLNVFLNDKKED
ncbi:hypothetical protein A3K48_01935 [candidate division WOR-1 bacterium RIFOXYA12_FULL_52_29]|uniref:Uncharacterized protein n=1 Tax=candidate division WOR-1 bacterium RIFOXYC12_FULL_54_18 TaxID=1802584 RepID=A0A1F4T5E3_UNCSA|nr:MAG: hypothetical protein A3K44_01935 [candidate division WOR-1 bacterium RIFOXYA2_FULL_51_19]OGC17343.1 MAG: hypothetical protein A3K48_01935 [candidate division WOR-1 bacterium RIFOXYA12_FULL_52_29]OGC26202.1 MAG: hypothetical protein A3K32_01930 [candidate division WOR-1 bacterium RIFOXYB2_FULL_45_9]OGC27760.1 MAG: hypothetical protein A3K49_01935 [candidate division WOR-1 bacterium RIFOXYC12_FULL_54_18]OGC29950.1 MAG: hypothetical protein A2346_04400 [candidate division WOR-1 bacterium R